MSTLNGQLCAITPPPLYEYPDRENPIEFGVQYIAYNIRPESLESYKGEKPTERTYKGFQVVAEIPIKSDSNLLISYWHSHKTHPFEDASSVPDSFTTPPHFGPLPIVPNESIAITRFHNSHLFQLRSLDVALLSQLFEENSRFSLKPRLGLRFCRLYQAITNQFSIFYLEGPPIQEVHHFNSNEKILGLGPEVGCHMAFRPFPRSIFLDGFEFFTQIVLSQIFSQFILENNFYIGSGHIAKTIVAQSTKTLTPFPVIDFSLGVSYDRELKLFDRRILGISVNVAFISEIWIGAEKHFNGTFNAPGVRNISLAGYTAGATLSF
ncbi:MAG: hypothetical protein ACOYK9_02725 [Chlamydiia bacterium]